MTMFIWKPILIYITLMQSSKTFNKINIFKNKCNFSFSLISFDKKLRQKVERVEKSWQRKKYFDRNLDSEKKSWIFFAVLHFFSLSWSFFRCHKLFFAVKVMTAKYVLTKKTSQLKIILPVVKFIILNDDVMIVIKSIDSKPDLAVPKRFV